VSRPAEQRLTFVDRRGTGCCKWDGQQAAFGVEGLLGMWVADMDIRSPDCVTDALRAYAERGVFGYDCPRQGFYESFLAWQRTRHGWDIPREWLRGTAGMAPAMNALIRLLTAPGDAVAVLTPVYRPFLDAVTRNGRTLAASPLLCRDGVCTIDFAGLERRMAESRARLLLLCSPHNPVGRVWRREELTRLLALCRERGAWIVCDEIHQDFTAPGHPHIPLGTLAGPEDRIAVLTSAGKTFNLAAFQNAVAILPDGELRARFDDHMAALGLEEGNPMGFLAGEAAYRGGGPWLDAVRRTVGENARRFCGPLKEALPGLIFSPLEGTYLLWADFGACLKPGETEAFFRDVCRLAVNPGPWFGGPPGCVRVNLAASPETVDLAAERILRGLTSNSKEALP